jgi:hypothetical protein
MQYVVLEMRAVIWRNLELPETVRVNGWGEEGGVHYALINKITFTYL